MTGTSKIFFSKYYKKKRLYVMQIISYSYKIYESYITNHIYEDAIKYVSSVCDEHKLLKTLVNHLKAEQFSYVVDFCLDINV